MQIKLFISAPPILCLMCDVMLCVRYVASLLSKKPSFLGQKTRERQKMSRNVGGLSNTAHGVTFQQRTIFAISTARTHLYTQNGRCPCPCAYPLAPVKSRLVIKTPLIQHLRILRLYVFIVKITHCYFRYRFAKSLNVAGSLCEQ